MKGYNHAQRLVGIDLWRGMIVVAALLIHATEIWPDPRMIAVGDFFSGYASIGVVFAGIAGMMGYLAYGRKVKDFKSILRREWVRGLKLGITYLVCWGLLALLGQSGIHWLSIYPTLAAVYMTAPIGWWLVAKIKRPYAGGLLALVTALTAVFLTENLDMAGALKPWLYDYWLNTTPLIPMLTTYWVGALVMELADRGQVEPAQVRLAWAAAAGWAVGRYWLNAHDIYPNNQWFFRLGLFAVLAVGFLGLKPKRWPRGLMALAYAGQNSYWVFTLGNLILGLGL